MKASEAGRAGSRSGPARWLLIGNSRWHWASGEPGALECWSEPPPGAPGDPSGRGQARDLRAWAAVGPVPAAVGLDGRRRLALSRVPLQRQPPWLGIDRALVGWQAWRSSGGAVLVADAGTALSFTLVDAGGGFAGGRIQAGLALQLRALASGTAQLPVLGPETWGRSVGSTRAEDTCMGDGWPTDTAEAMVVGVREGLVAAVREAWTQARACHTDCRLWITGGDGAWIAESLGMAHRPGLALEGLASLGSDPDFTPDQGR